MISAIDHRLLVGFLGLSALITAGMTMYAYRHRDRPGAVWLAATLGATTIWTGTYAGGLLTHDATWRPVWEHIQWFGTAALPVTFLLFALEYTGHDRSVTRWTMAGLFAIPALTVGIVWTNQWHSLMWIENRVVVQEGLATMVATFGPWFWVATIYSYALVIIGGVLLIRLLFVSEYLYAEQSILFSLGIVIPLIANVIAVFIPTSPPGFDFTPYGFTVWGTTLFVMVYRGGLFDLIPATRQLGQNAALAQFEEGVAIVDDDDTVIYLNEAAGSIFDCKPASTVGESIEKLLGEGVLEELASQGEETVTDFHRGDRFYEIRISQISDRHGRPIGRTLVFHDVTIRRRRERELERVTELNTAIRGVHQALVDARRPENVHEAICEKVGNSELYGRVCLADVPTITGAADEWQWGTDVCQPPELSTLETKVEEDSGREIVDTDREGTWTIVPVTYRRTLYGVLCVRPNGQSLSERERDALFELGELAGHTINAIEHRQLLAADAVVELSLESDDADASLAAVSNETDTTVTLEGLIPGGESGPVAILSTDAADGKRVQEALARITGDPVTVTQSDTSSGDVLSWRFTEESLLGTLATLGVSVTAAVAEDGQALYRAEVATDRDVRQLLSQLEVRFPETRLVAKNHKDQPTELLETESDTVVEDLTDRQCEAIEAAYRAGYFDWPRESTAEEVAESLDITPPTLHGHLRKAEHSIFRELFDQPGK